MRTPRINTRKNTMDDYIYNEVVVNNVYQFNSTYKTVVDIGANVGIFSSFAAEKGASVCAFEPEKESYRLLIKNTKGKVKTFNYAIGKKKKRKLFINETNSGGHSFYGSGNYQIVDVITLNQSLLLSGFTVCDFLKVDCEGAEYEIFEDARIFKKIKRISMEIHDGEQKALLKLLERYYSIDVFNSYPEPNKIVICHL